MPLPKIDQPLFEMVIPSTSKKVKYRPFTVKEEKILLIAQESKDQDQIILAIKQILNNCLIDIDVDELAVFDLEYIMLNLRAKGVNDKIEFSITDPETEEVIELEINISDIEIKKNKKHNKIIKITDDISLQMRYPTIDYVKTLANNQNNATVLFDIMKSCIHSVIEGDSVYKLDEFSDDEKNEFIDSLNTKTMEDIKNFFDTIPTMRFEVPYTRKDGTSKKFIAEGFETFFI